MIQILRCLLVAEVPDAAIVKDLYQHIRADRMGDPGVKKVSCVDDDRASPSLRFKRIQRLQQVVDRAMPLQQVHVLHATEKALQRSR